MSCLNWIIVCVFLAFNSISASPLTYGGSTSIVGLLAEPAEVGSTVSPEQDKILDECFIKAAKKFSDPGWLEYGTLEFCNSKFPLGIVVSGDVAEFSMFTWGTSKNFLIVVHPKIFLDLTPNEIEKAFRRELLYVYYILVSEIWEGRQIDYLCPGDFLPVRNQRKSMAEILKFRFHMGGRIKASMIK
ncbi:MAG: hypothetical protein WC797_00665 [Candidatus Paceibacterota bacterium]